MIIGAAHVVVNTADISAAQSAYEGAEPSFTQLDLPTEPLKDSFQARPRERFDVLHIEREHGADVEITRYHGDPPAGRAPYVLKLEAGQPPLVTMGVDDMAAGVEFWRSGMRFMPGHTAGMFSAPAMEPSRRLDLRLDPRPGPAEPTSIDAHGCVLVTVLSSGLERELQRLHDTGLLLRISPAWRETIGGQERHGALVEGPNGELVELLEAPRR